jgi:hypothetical protein
MERRGQLAVRKKVGSRKEGGGWLKTGMMQKLLNCNGKRKNDYN